MRQSMVPSPDNRYGYNGKELQEKTQWHDYGARMYDGALGRFFTQDRFAEKYLDFSPYQYAAGNPVKYIDVNGDSIAVSFMDEKGRKLNQIPEIIQKMFNNEYGISVGYNSSTGMMYYTGEVKTENSISESAKSTIVSALKDEVGGSEAKAKYGKITFGYGKSMDPALPFEFHAGLSHRVSNNAWIDLKDFNKDGTVKGFDYSPLLQSGGSKRTYNLARVFEHEWIGHIMKDKGDGMFWNIRPGGAANVVNKFRREMGLAERLNYGGHHSLGIFFSKDTSRKNFRRLRKSARRGLIVPYIKF